MAKQNRKQAITITVDPLVWSRCKELGEIYDVSWSEIAQTAFFQVLQALEEIETLRLQNPEGLPLTLVRSYLVQKVHQSSGDTMSIVDELYPEPSQKKTKAKA